MARAAVPGTRVELVLPEALGFRKATGFLGFEHVDPSGGEIEATIGVTELPVPLDAMRAQWARNAALAREELSIDGAPALWVHAREETPTGPVLRWLLAVEAADRTILVVAAAPEASPEPLRLALGHAVRTARLAPTPFPGDALPFIFEAGPRLKEAARMGSVVLLTEQGQVGKDARDPMLTLGAGSTEEDPPSEGAADLLQLSGRHLQAVPGLMDFEQRDAAPLVTPAGDRAYRLVGEALFRGVDAPVTLYQLVVVHDRPGGGHDVWVAVGRAEASIFPSWADELHAVAMSLRAP